jgi:hypothetical protein
MTQRLALVVFAVAVATAPAVAQTLTMGNVITSPNSSDFPIAATRTDIDLVHPANATGNIATARFNWAAFPCPNAAKIKFFRRSGANLTLVAERGPFNVTGSDNIVTLSPAVAVQQGDLIGITRLTNCGNVGALFGIVTAGSLIYAGDLAGTTTFAAGTRRGEVIAISASGAATERVAAVLPVVGSTAGSFGSNFKTALQMANGFTFGPAISGRLVLRRQGTPGSSADPSLPFTIAPGAVLSFPDIVATLGFNGLGSLDVIIPTGTATPVITARVYNDAGLAGTAGLSELAIDPFDERFAEILPPLGPSLFMGATAVMITPSEPARTRFNIGVRSFFSGASLTATLRNPDGSTVATVTKTYLPNSFEQTSAESFFGGIAIGANQTISIGVGDGSALIYGATTDNVTNDPSIQMALVVFAIA